MNNYLLPTVLGWLIIAMSFITFPIWINLIILTLVFITLLIFLHENEKSVKKMHDKRLLSSKSVSKNDDSFQLMLDKTKDYALFMLDTKGHVANWNTGAERLKGYSFAEINDQHFSCFYTPEDIERGVAEQLLRKAVLEGYVDDQGWRVRKDGSRFWAKVLVTALHDNTGQLIGFSKLVQDITEKKQNELKIHELNVQLEELVNQRTTQLELSLVELQRFAHAAAHDLQTPLRSISGFVRLLQSEYKGRIDEQADDWIRRTMESVLQMQSLIRDMLAYIRIGTGGQAFERVDLNKVCEKVVEALKGNIQKENAKIIIEILPTVEGDKSQLVLLFQNLIENALKYRSIDTPLVYIYAEKKEDMWIISVKDNGIGIGKEHLLVIFDVFHRLHTLKQYSGTGIGLAICRRIVERHGGTIWVDSQINNGSTFHFSLPKI